MFTIRANPEKNYLYIFLDGYLNEKTIHAAIQVAKSEAKKLSFGFTIINNLSNYKPASPAGAKAIARTQRYLYDQGARQVVRILGENVLGKHQWRKTQIDGGAAFDVIEVSTVEEARKVLLSVSSRSK